MFTEEDGIIINNEDKRILNKKKNAKNAKNSAEVFYIWPEISSLLELHYLQRHQRLVSVHELL